jgi:hypothetical protein
LSFCRTEVRLHVGDKKRVSIKERILSWRKARGKRRMSGRKWNWVGTLKVAAVVGLLVGTGFFLRYAEGFVRAANADERGNLILVEVPAWVNHDLKARVAEMAGGSRFLIRDETAEVIARNLAPMAWLDDVSVQVTFDSVRVKARWRKPVALIQGLKGATKYYVDSDLVVLDYMPMPQLPIVEVKGMTAGLAPTPGERFDRDDLAAAVALISLLYRSDAEFSPKTPLLEQIESIDVGNFKGRKHARDPHILLNTKDGTQVIWGAEIGEWAKHLEAKDEDKLARLYTYYMKTGSLSAGVKYIYLRDPQDRVYMPIDKYRN